MINTHVNSDWAKTMIVTFVSKIINIKSVQDQIHKSGFIRVIVEMDTNLSAILSSV